MKLNLTIHPRFRIGWFPLILLMFVVEYGIRLRKLPHQKKHSIMDGVLAYWKTPATRAGVSPPTH